MALHATVGRKGGDGRDVPTRNMHRSARASWGSGEVYCSMGLR
jgi:hypothetical protein